MQVVWQTKKHIKKAELKNAKNKLANLCKNKNYRMSLKKIFIIVRCKENFVTKDQFLSCTLIMTALLLHLINKNKMNKILNAKHHQ